MTYWADNIKFIKDILDSKYKKIEDAIVDIDEHAKALEENAENKKAKEGFVESSRMVELIDLKELEGLAETMFKDMPELERGKEQDRLKDVATKFSAIIEKIKALKAKFNIQ